MFALGIASLLLAQTSGYRYKFIAGTEFERGLPASRFGLTEDEMIQREDRVWGLVLQPDMDFRPTELGLLAGRLKALGDSVSTARDSAECRAYFDCLAIGAWVKSHVAAPQGGNREMSGQGTDGVVIQWEGPKSFNLAGMLSCTSLQGFCRHSTVLARKLLLDAVPGADVSYVSGWAGPLGEKREVTRDHAPNHGWNLVDLGKGIKFVMDCTGTSRNVAIYRELYATHRRSPDPINMIPRYPDELEVFLATHYGGSLNKSWGDADANGLVPKRFAAGRPPWQDLAMKMSVEQWWATDTADTAKLRTGIMNSWRRRR